MKSAGGSSPIGLDTAEAIAQRRKLAKSCIDANAALTVSCRSTESDLLTALRRVVPEADARAITQRAMTAYHPDDMLRLRDSERRSLEAVDGELALLQQEFGRWHLDAEKKLAFDNPAVIPWYQRYSAQLKSSAEVETRIRQEINARSQARAAGR